VKPNGQTNHFDFYDDGTHGDLTQGDGIYSFSFSPELVGSYSFLLTAQKGLVQRVETMNLAVQPTATRPTLIARCMGTVVELSWTTEIGAFLLEGNTNLSTTNWFAQNVLPEVNSNNLHTVKLNATGQRYFRLRGP
jgi:hypothetical protein